MIQALREWLFSLVAAAMLLSALQTLLPKRMFQSIGRVTGGLALTLVLLRPILTMQWENLSDKYQGYEQQIDRQIEVYTQDNRQQMEDIIEQQLNAYVWETAAQMGLDCEAEVDTELRDGVLQPVSVRLYTDYNELLSERISRELGIAPEQQHWGGSK